VDRALPLAERIAARQAAPRLLRGALRVELRIDLAELSDAHLDRQFRRIGAREVEELKILVSHRFHAARRRFSMSESIEAALGFTTQNLPM
jgi:hypothetical protein